VYRIARTGVPVPLVAVESPSLPRGHTRGMADRLAAKIVAGSSETRALDQLDVGGELMRAGAMIRDSATNQPVGVVIASGYLSGDLARNARRITEVYENYSQTLALRRPLQGVYRSLFLLMTLMIIVRAPWPGRCLGQRITRPVQLLAAGAREIGAGRLDHRIEPETRDEFGSLVEAFNTMAGELAASQRKLERSRVDLERKNLQLDERRRYIETVLERIATGVVSVGADERIETINAAAVRLLELDPSVVGRSASDVFAREDLKPLHALLARMQKAATAAAAQEIALAREGRELHLAAAARCRGKTAPSPAPSWCSTT
jgi:two-component system, NtrC family, nitrogen regulation sensor histidine kinase NtrY